MQPLNLKQEREREINDFRFQIEDLKFFIEKFYYNFI